MDGNFTMDPDAAALALLGGSPTATPAALGEILLTPAPTPFALNAGFGDNGPLPVGTLGKIALWTGTALMVLPTFVFYKKMISEGEGRERLFHVLTVTVTAMASMAYLFMALGKGYIWIGDRPLYYMRYIDWLVTTPVLLLDLCLLASAEAEKTALLFLLDALMVIGGFLGAMITNWSKYFFWAVSTLMYIPIAIELLTSINHCAAKAGPDVLAVYTTLSRLTVVVWSVYPFIWIVGEGAFVISADLEACLYMIIDVTAKSVFGYLLLASHHTLKMASEVYEFGGAPPPKEKKRTNMNGIPMDMNFPCPSVDESHRGDSPTSSAMQGEIKSKPLLRRPTLERTMFAAAGSQADGMQADQDEDMDMRLRRLNLLSANRPSRHGSSRHRLSQTDDDSDADSGMELLSSLRNAAMGVSVTRQGPGRLAIHHVDFEQCTEHSDGHRIDRAIQASGPEIGPTLWPSWLLSMWGYDSE